MGDLVDEEVLRIKSYIEDPSDANFCTMCSDLTTGCPATLPAVLEKKCSPKAVDNVDNSDVGLNSHASPVIKAGQQTQSADGASESAPGIGVVGSTVVVVVSVLVFIGLVIVVASTVRRKASSGAALEKDIEGSPEYA